MKYKYKGKEFDIRVASEEGWKKKKGYFYVYNDQPYDIPFCTTYERIKEKIREAYDSYHSLVPETEKGWLDLFKSCVIRDGYEDWHIDEKLAMRLLKLYKKHGE